MVTVICVIAAPMLLAKAGGWAGLHAALPAHVLSRCWAIYRMSGGVRGPVSGLSRARVPGADDAADAWQPGDVSEVFLSADRSGTRAISVVGWTLGTLVLETLIVAIAVFGPALYPDR